MRHRAVSMSGVTISARGSDAGPIASASPRQSVRPYFESKDTDNPIASDRMHSNAAAAIPARLAA